MDAIRSQVVIAGGGMVGLTLAIALARGGFEVAVADPMTAEQMGDERFDGRVAALAFASVRMLRVLGLWQRLEREAQPINDILVNESAVGKGPSPFSLHFDHREIGEPLGHIVENRHIRQALLAEMAAEERIRFFPALGDRARRQSDEDRRIATLVEWHRDRGPFGSCRRGTRVRAARGARHRHYRLGLWADRHRDDRRP